MKNAQNKERRNVKTGIKLTIEELCIIIIKVKRYKTRAMIYKKLKRK